MGGKGKWRYPFFICSSWLRLVTLLAPVQLGGAVETGIECPSQRNGLHPPLVPVAWTMFRRFVLKISSYTQNGNMQWVRFVAVFRSYVGVDVGRASCLLTGFCGCWNDFGSDLYRVKWNEKCTHLGSGSSHLLPKVWSGVHTVKFVTFQTLCLAFGNTVSIKFTVGHIFSISV